MIALAAILERGDEMADEELTLDTLKTLAMHAGLDLTDDELRDVMPGVVRNRERARALERWVTPEVELPTVSPVPQS